MGETHRICPFLKNNEYVDPSGPCLHYISGMARYSELLPYFKTKMTSGTAAYIPMGVDCRLWCRETSLSPPVKYFTDRSKAVLLFGSFVLFMSCVCHAFGSILCCLVVTCWERADLLTLVCDV